MRKLTKKQFLSEFDDERELLEHIKELSPVQPVDLQRFVTYHPNPKFCENRLWAMLGLLDEFDCIDIRDGYVVTV